MGMLTKLQAVNRILRAASEPPVESLTTDPTNESLIAENILDEVNIHAQMAGLHSNTIIQAFIPDPVTFEIVLPDTTLHAMAWWNENRVDDPGGTDLPDNRDRDFTIRGSAPGGVKLFDKDRLSFTFPDDDSVTLKITLLLDFEELPTPQQFRVVDHAARLYEAATQGDPAIGQLLAAEAGLSRAMARADEMRSRRPNAFTTGQNTLAHRMNRVRRDWF